MKRREVGRPRLPEAEARAVMVGVRVRRIERDLIQKAAETQGKTVSDWARDILVREAARQVRVSASARPAAQAGKSLRSKKET